MATSARMDPAPVYRHPLGLPPGSIRAALALMIVGLFWVILLLPADRTVQTPAYLYFLLSLLFVFFGAHGHSIAPHGTRHHSPWYLPRGTFRWLIVLGTAGVVGWQYYRDPNLVTQRLTPTPDEVAQWPGLLLASLGGFVLGWVAGLGPWRRSYWFHDIQAWVSLLAMIFLGAEILIRGLIRPSLMQTWDLPVWEGILVGIVAFYFGVRSRPSEVVA